jgi:hypothetical protein
MALVGVWIVSTIRSVEELAEKARADYAELESDFPFDPAERARAPSPERLRAYERARLALVEAVPPEIERPAADLFASGKVSGAAFIREALHLRRLIQSAARAHLESLRAERMGPTEYAWLHGWAMRDVLSRPESDPARERAVRALEGLDRLSASAVSKGAPRFEAETFRRELALIYDGLAPLEGIAIPADELDNKAVAAIHLLTADARWMDRLIDASQPPSAANSDRPPPR